MLLGPVFRAELLRTGRRTRYYVLRALYGVLLLVLVWTGYEGTFHGANEATIRTLAQFGLVTFVTFATVQLATVLVLIPPLFAGAIADEKQRKTLHYLMASQLSGGEIILDKMLGRAANLAVFLLIGLPITSLLALFGGVAADYIVVAYLGTFSTAAFAVALTMLVSTLARRVRQALLIAYVALLAWLFLPTMVAAFGITLFATSYPNIQYIVDGMKDSSPIGVWFALWFGRWAGLSRMNIVWDRVEWMVELQLGGAALLLLLSVLLLRPVFRRHEGTPARRTWFKPAKPSEARP
ncbi:ABC transporter permease, partial [Singulisphaera rosea]